MSNFVGVELAVSDSGARFGYDFLKSATDVGFKQEVLAQKSDEELAGAFFLAVSAGVALARVLQAREAEGKRARISHRASQVGVSAVSSAILEEVSLRDEEMERVPPQAEVLVGRARELHPDLTDPGFLDLSGLELDGEGAGIRELSESYA